MQTAAKRLWGAGILVCIAGFPQAARGQAASTPPDTPEVSVTVQQTDHPYVKLSASPGSYVIVVRVSDDLRVHVLYPASPATQNAFPAGPGFFPLPLDIPMSAVGGIYAVASNVPFNFSAISSGDRWNGDALILQKSRSAEHAANRVFGKITPGAAVTSTAEAVYFGSESARVAIREKLYERSSASTGCFSYAMSGVACGNVPGLYDVAMWYFRGTRGSGREMRAPVDPWARQMLGGHPGNHAVTAPSSVPSRHGGIK